MQNIRSILGYTDITVLEKSSHLIPETLDREMEEGFKQWLRDQMAIVHSNGESSMSVMARRVTSFFLNCLVFLLISGLLYGLGSLFEKPILPQLIVNIIPENTPPVVEGIVTRLPQPALALVAIWRWQDYLIDPLMSWVFPLLKPLVRGSPDFLYILPQKAEESSDILNFQTRAVEATGMPQNPTERPSGGSS